MTRTMLDVALQCIARGWFVFPCKPRGKEPLVKGGFKAAMNRDDVVRAWWEKWPDANVGIATGASGLTVLDIDGGLNDEEDLRLFRIVTGLPETYTVRTGRRPGFGVQMYFETGGDAFKSIAWMSSDDETVFGDIRGGTGYVIAAGCPTLAALFTRSL